MALTKITVQALTVVGWLLILATVLDIVFALWDPFNYNKQQPANAPIDMMLSGERQLRSLIGQTDLVYTFDMLVNLVLSKEELLEIQLESMIEHAYYLQHLIVNSEGTVIEHEQPLYVPEGSTGDAEPYVRRAQREAFASQRKFDSNTYRKYYEQFALRVHVNEHLNTAAWFVGAAVTCTAASQLYLISVVLLLVFIVLVGLSRINIENATIMKTFELLGFV